MHNNCPVCFQNDIKSIVRPFQINYEEAIILCSNPTCEYLQEDGRCSITSRKIGTYHLENKDNTTVDIFRTDQEVSDSLNLNTPPLTPGNETLPNDSTVQNASEISMLINSDDSEIDQKENLVDDFNDRKITDLKINPCYNLKINPCYNKKSEDLKIIKDTVINNINPINLENQNKKALGKLIFYKDKKICSNDNFLQINPHNLNADIKTENNSELVKIKEEYSIENNLNGNNNKNGTEYFQKFNHGCNTKFSNNLVSENNTPNIKSMLITNRPKNNETRVLKYEKSNSLNQSAIKPITSKFINRKKNKVLYESFDFEKAKNSNKPKIKDVKDVSLVKFITSNEIIEQGNKVILPSNIKTSNKIITPLNQYPLENWDQSKKEDSSDNSLVIYNNKNETVCLQKNNFCHIGKSSNSFVSEINAPNIKIEDNARSGMLKHEKSNSSYQSGIKSISSKLTNRKKNKVRFESFDFEKAKNLSKTKVNDAQDISYAKVLKCSENINKIIEQDNKEISLSNIKPSSSNLVTPLKQHSSDNCGKNKNNDVVIEIIVPSDANQNVPVTKILDNNLELSNVNSKVNFSNQDDVLEGLNIDDLEFLSSEDVSSKVSIIKEEPTDETINESLIRNRIRSKAFIEKKKDSDDFNNSKNNEDKSILESHDMPSTNTQLYTNYELLHCLEDSDSESLLTKTNDLNNLEKSSDDLCKNLSNQDSANSVVNLSDTNGLNNLNPSNDSLYKNLNNNSTTNALVNLNEKNNEKMEIDEPKEKDNIDLLLNRYLSNNPTNETEEEEWIEELFHVKE